MADNSEDNVRVVKTDNDAINGQTKCPKCGATDISLNLKTGKLRCNFCRCEFENEIAKSELDYDDISTLYGEIIGAGAQNIDSENTMVTIKCSSCGAEIVIDTNEATNARCHWCRNVLSINDQVPNGAVPDVVLPFGITKDEAKKQIEQFVGKRKFFAHPRFRKEFTAENVMGIYLPYMIIDVNSHATFIGEGEHQTRSYTVGSDDNKKTYYDADLYSVARDFDMTIDDLTIETSSDKLNKSDATKTNNIINSIMPFDTKNCVKWDSNYLRGFTSEKRDTNIEELKPKVDMQVEDIARIGINDTLENYDRGVRWDTQNMEIKGRSWKTAYLPVWLYSYQQKKGKKGLLHYVAVNARTKETMGSVPIHIPKLFAVSCLVEVFSWFAKGFIDDMVKSDYTWLILSSGFIFYAVMYARYRNQGARHHHESETTKNIFNVKKEDSFIKSKKGLSNRTMEGANNTTVKG